jgi:2-polyprenyl-3-methyl-5-hydroxy-6-metoxy-1,4-benzoquinol methylase
MALMSQTMKRQKNDLYPVNKTMEQEDLLSEEAQKTVKALDILISKIYLKRQVMTSWYGTLEAPFTEVGFENRSTGYRALPGVVDDNRIPWFLYWEIEWVMRNGPRLKRGMRVLDAGGTSSLFSCYLASLGLEVHSIDINPVLVNNAKKLSSAMNWNMHAYEMGIENMLFEEHFFDHAFSICVFEHLDFYTKQKALIEIHRALKPGGEFCLTFDYVNPAPYVFSSYGYDKQDRNALNSPERVKKVFCGNNLFKVKGNQEFHDSGKRYLQPPRDACINPPKNYTFGALFLRRKDIGKILHDVASENKDC